MDSATTLLLGDVGSYMDDGDADLQQPLWSYMSSMLLTSTKPDPDLLSGLAARWVSYHAMDGFAVEGNEVIRVIAKEVRESRAKVCELDEKVREAKAECGCRMLAHQNTVDKMLRNTALTDNPYKFQARKQAADQWMSRMENALRSSSVAPRETELDHASNLFRTLLEKLVTTVQSENGPVMMLPDDCKASGAATWGEEEKDLMNLMEEAAKNDPPQLIQASPPRADAKLEEPVAKEDVRVKEDVEMALVATKAAKMVFMRKDTSQLEAS
ncbi:unnamed protein product [Effrenium voratum]|uniref:Uncharacterized protein n=1 Tax=Effrenium voratum TaxID=2562239 RepID=A0AA36INH2_9DINO|nr:unnamed protein product [Effrenium voratum]